MIKKLFKRVFGKSVHTRIEGRCHIIPQDVHGVRRDKISPAARKVTDGLQAAGYAAFVVGGAVRDLLLDRHPKDFDIATDATHQRRLGVYFAVRASLDDASVWCTCCLVKKR
jgi:poly(A) polymerase